MCGERGSNLFMKRCIRLNLQGKVAQFFSRGYVALLGTTGYKLPYSSRIRMIYLAAQQQNKVINFRFVLTLVCFSPLYFQILVTGLREAHRNSISSLEIPVWSITQPCHVSVHRVLSGLRQSQGPDFSSLQVSSPFIF